MLAIRILFLSLLGVVTTTSALPSVTPDSSLSIEPAKSLEVLPDNQLLPRNDQPGGQRMTLQWNRTGRFYFTMGIRLANMPYEVLAIIRDKAHERGSDGQTASDAFLQTFKSWLGDQPYYPGVSEIYSLFPSSRSQGSQAAATQISAIFARSAAAAENMIGFGFQLKTHSDEINQGVIELIKHWAGDLVKVIQYADDSFLPDQVLSTGDTQTGPPGLGKRARTNQCPKALDLLKYADTLPQYDPARDLAASGHCDG